MSNSRFFRSRNFVLAATLVAATAGIGVAGIGIALADEGDTSRCGDGHVNGKVNEELGRVEVTGNGVCPDAGAWSDAFRKCTADFPTTHSVKFVQVFVAPDPVESVQIWACSASATP